MSDLINTNPLPEKKLEEEQPEHSPWAMFFSILLMISGFLFASALLVQNTISARSAEGEPLFQLSEIIEKGNPFRTRTSEQEAAIVEPPPAEDKSSPLEGLKQMISQPSETVRWPKLRLTGFGRSSNGIESYAYINDDLVHPGEYSGKVMLVEVRAHDVIVEYKGERKTLTVEMKN